ncbi:unnamed protein product [Mucor hiemalis]
MPHEIHIPYLSEDEKIFLNTAATYSQARRMSNTIDAVRPSIEDNTHQQRPHSNNHHHRRQQVVSVSSLSFLWKRRGSSASSLTLSSSTGSMDYCQNEEYGLEEGRSDPQSSKSPKGRELESLIFDQPQRTVRLSLTPRCAV